jgi:hypothetical protein
MYYSRLEEQLQEHLHLNKSTISLPVTIGSLDSPLRPHTESDLPTDLYFGSTPMVNMDKSDRWISFNRLKKSVISLLATIGASDSPLGPHPERDLATDLYSDSTPITIKDESDRQISFKWLQEIYNITTRGDQGIWLFSRNLLKNRSRYRSILWLCTSSPLWWDGSIRLQRPCQVIKHLVDLSLSWVRLT